MDLCYNLICFFSIIDLNIDKGSNHEGTGFNLSLLSPDYSARSPKFGDNDLQSIYSFGHKIYGYEQNKISNSSQWR